MRSEIASSEHSSDDGGGKLPAVDNRNEHRISDVPPGQPELGSTPRRSSHADFMIGSGSPKSPLFGDE